MGPRGIDFLYTIFYFWARMTSGKPSSFKSYLAAGIFHSREPEDKCPFPDPGYLIPQFQQL